MPLTGMLKSWDDDRGFGFIARTHGGRDLFVHISAFPPDGSRPTVGETLNYEIGLGQNGKPQAVRVYREAQPSTSSRTRARVSPSHSPLAVLVGLVFMVVIGAYVYSTYEQADLATPTPPQSLEDASSPQSVNQEIPAPTPAEQAVTTSQDADPVEISAAPQTDEVVSAPQSVYRCDGRTRCSQMTSCFEAEFFLKNCPGVQMDGDNDGVPCEQQWCANPR